ncbi:dihydrodipicolinate synthase family protein [Parapedobacter indicus]|uniref:Dihydrodipicolinate synthase/N-acetylneuraminate lyase n=1 Tax=Parapedobacter indicus TaxID=1477437 RepID=A0A1I3FR49_9SPHI|nr:dihydrodipicolinate synthase family protein [Parapedobacter indicus]PPL03847.1 dihydrodipicolinate synthase/N-acetylneuraminate lyase [Parapedobacter indicus]SFI13654.1 Dihydrodipicolinate synthase/N-acetylneuraminate lyase [Parapedobacter indicus]
MATQQLSSVKATLLRQGTVIPAHPLALKSDRQLDEEYQRLLTRYYLASGAGGVAVGVHSTQFAIRDPEVNLYEKVLALAAEEMAASPKRDTFIAVAGICGDTDQALKEAAIALRHGYDLGLLSMGGLQGKTETEILDRTRAVAEVIPVFGFYLQPSVGGRIFSYDFWKAFAEIPNVHAIKAAPFNRYQTLDLVRAVCHSNRSNEITLYTGNDDNIVADLLTTYEFEINGKTVSKRFEGGLLGHWAVWTHAAVKLFNEVKQCREHGYEGTADLLKKGVAVTDMNAAIFDPAHRFHGCIPGIHEVLRRQGLMKGIWCLDPDEKLSPGQAEEITRVCEAYPELIDDDFVREFLRTNS